jgi:hypothetical protein
MKYKTAFRLALRVVGVYFLAEGGAEAIHAAGFAVDFLGGTAFGGVSWSGYTMIGTAVTKIAIGTYLFLGGKWIANLAIPSNRPYCPECGYELTGLPESHNCPECGVPFPLGAPGQPPAHAEHSKP